MADQLLPLRMYLPHSEDTFIEVRAIVSIDRAGIIGYDNHLIFNNPNDLKTFRAKTIGRIVVMGRKTFESIGRILPGRQTVILTHDPKSYTKNVLKNYCHKLDADTPMPIATNRLDQTIPELCETYGSRKVWIVGGSELYRSCSNAICTWMVTEYAIDLEQYLSEKDRVPVGVKYGLLPKNYDYRKLTKLDRIVYTNQASVNTLELGHFNINGNDIRYSVKSYNRMGRLPYGKPTTRGKTIGEIEEINRRQYSLPQDEHYGTEVNSYD